MPILITYFAALLQGLAVVSYPASASILKTQLGDSAYGAMFLPQMIATILGSLLGTRLGPAAVRGSVLAAACLANAVAELALWLVPQGLGLPAALFGTFALGFGFGLAAAPLGGLPGRLFPQRADAALVALHTLLAAGFALGPLLVSAAQTAGVWPRVPLAIAACALMIACLAPFAIPAPAPSAPSSLAAAPASSAADSGARRATWLFGAIVVLYALSEGTFANWAVVYLREERSLSARAAALALSWFWCALAVGRLLVSALLKRVRPELIWRLLPLGMIAAFLCVPAVASPEGGMLAFAGAGLACSAFFPLSVSLAARQLPGGTARASALLTAALMVGVGLGSFVVGPLRAGTSLATLYRASALYPALVLLLTSWSSRRWSARGSAGKPFAVMVGSSQREDSGYL